MLNQDLTHQHQEVSRLFALGGINNDDDWLDYLMRMLPIELNWIMFAWNPTTMATFFEVLQTINDQQYEVSMENSYNPYSGYPMFLAWRMAPTQPIYRMSEFNLAFQEFPIMPPAIPQITDALVNLVDQMVNAHLNLERPRRS